MMLTTHILAGASLGLLFLSSDPEVVFPVMIVGLFGSIFPDLDMFAEHRKTLHRPFQMLIVSALFALVFTVYSVQAILLAAVFTFSMSLHCFMDILSNGKTMHPRTDPDDRAVYNRVTDSWIEPRRLVLDGSVPDMILTIVFGIILVVLLPSYSMVFYTFMGAGVLYTLLTFRLRNRYADYDRYSQIIQKKVGLGPEVSPD
jgi:hypothetical protein